MIDKILEKFGLNFDDLRPEERVTLLGMVDAAQQGQLTVEKIRETIANLRYQVTLALVAEPEYKHVFIFKVLNRNHVYLKARLMNYVMLENMLSTPEKQQQRIEQAVANIATGVVG